MNRTKTSTIRVVWPLLVVVDPDASIAFWTERLGFATGRRVNLLMLREHLSCPARC